jgi:methylated-DNA-[protein]-cysteine S-methyltransferase
VTDLQPPAVDARALVARFAAAAPADVLYATVDTPVGLLVAARTPRGLARLSYADFHGGVDAVVEALAERLSPRVLEAPARLDAERRELDEYFAGRRRTFGLELDLVGVAPFTRRVLEATARIPFGATSTYREVAGAAGSPKAFRATGNALGANPVPIVVPCHRVLASGGRLGGYTGGTHRKEVLLELEGALPARPP